MWKMTSVSGTQFCYPNQIVDLMASCRILQEVFVYVVKNS